MLKLTQKQKETIKSNFFLYASKKKYDLDETCIKFDSMLVEEEQVAMISYKCESKGMMIMYLFDYNDGTYSISLLYLPSGWIDNDYYTNEVSNRLKLDQILALFTDTCPVGDKKLI